MKKLTIAILALLALTLAGCKDNRTPEQRQKAFDAVKGRYIKEFNYRVDKLMVNFGQTVLREGMDYTINKLTGGIDLINGFELSTDDILQFVVVKQKEF